MQPDRPADPGCIGEMQAQWLNGLFWNTSTQTGVWRTTIVIASALYHVCALLVSTLAVHPRECIWRRVWRVSASQTKETGSILLSLPATPTVGSEQME